MQVFNYLEWDWFYRMRLIPCQKSTRLCWNLFLIVILLTFQGWTPGEEMAKKIHHLVGIKLWPWLFPSRSCNVSENIHFPFVWPSLVFWKFAREIVFYWNRFWKSFYLTCFTFKSHLTASVKWWLCPEVCSLRFLDIWRVNLTLAVSSRWRDLLTSESTADDLSFMKKIK